MVRICLGGIEERRKEEGGWFGEVRWKGGSGREMMDACHCGSVPGWEICTIIVLS